MAGRWSRAAERLGVSGGSREIVLENVRGISPLLLLILLYIAIGFHLQQQDLRFLLIKPRCTLFSKRRQNLTHTLVIFDVSHFVILFYTAYLALFAPLAPIVHRTPPADLSSIASGVFYRRLYSYTVPHLHRISHPIRLYLARLGFTISILFKDVHTLAAICTLAIYSNYAIFTCFRS